MKEEEIKELHSLLEAHCQKKNYTPSQVLAFLSISFAGTMAMHGFSEDFFDATCKRMKAKFREKKSLFGKAPI